MKQRDSLYGAGNSMNSIGKSAGQLFLDHEVKMLLLWSILSPSAALAYIIWVRYPQLKFLAILLFVISIFQFAGQWAGVFTILQKMGLVAT